MKLLLIYSVFICTFSFILISKASEDLKLAPKQLKILARNKRGDIDLKTCIDNFNIHKDKIIRTQDSQNMGAKYLNEIDLGSREECLRLCCETTDCDVFVFEEKNSGSCYLFHCGPPEDFKCKFTHHVNYSSAVLSVNRHVPDLESEIKLTKHEKDLNQLRKSDEIITPEVINTVSITKSTSTTAPALGYKELLPQTMEVQPKTLTEDNDRKKALTPAPPVSKCHRFQFECRSTSECIAIYNACDGIPQCADGSDEAPDLKCPNTDPNLVQNVQNIANSPPPQQTVVSAANKYDPAMIQQNQANINQLTQTNNQNNQNIYRPPGVIRENIPMASGLARPDSGDFLTPNNDPNVMNNAQPYQYPVQTVQQHWRGQIMPQNGGQYHIPDIVNGGSRIFTHKETGLQVPQSIDMGGNQIQQQYMASGLPIRPDYVQKVNYYGSNYNRQDGWPLTNDRYPQEMIVDQNLKPATNTYKVPLSNQLAKPEEVNPKHIQDKMAHDLKHSKENMPRVKPASVNEPVIKIEKHPSTHVHETYPDVVAYKISDSDLHDGAAQTPRAAVVFLTLGLLITCMLAILIACRLKVLRRRIRRNGKSYAHDADYLVNGMYL